MTDFNIETVGNTAVKFPIQMVNGETEKVELSLETYAAAANYGMTLTGFLSAMYPNADLKQGSVFEQMCNRAGIMSRSDQKTGMSSTTFRQIEQGINNMTSMGVITRPDSSVNSSLAGRLLVPEIILQVINQNLSSSNDDFFNGIDSMVGITENVSGDKVDQPLINVTAPEGSAAERVAQLAPPKIMVGITTNEKSFRIPTLSIGAQISEQAQSAVTLDLVTLAVSAQARGERIRHYERYLKAMIDGDSDLGESAVTADLVTAYDSDISDAMTMTQKAYLKFLRQNYRKLNIDYLMMDMDTAIAVDGRSGRPYQDQNRSTSPQLNVDENVMNLNIKAPNVLIVDSDIVGAGNIVAIDSRHAIRRVRNVSASYQAIENNVIRRSTTLRIDYGEIMHKLFPEAWQRVELATS